MDAEDDAAEFVSDVVFEVPGFGIEGIEAVGANEDADEEGERRFGEMEAVADEEGEEGVGDEETGEDEVGEVRGCRFQFLPHDAECCILYAVSVRYHFFLLKLWYSLSSVAAEQAVSNSTKASSLLPRTHH